MKGKRLKSSGKSTIESWSKWRGNSMKMSLREQPAENLWIKLCVRKHKTALMGRIMISNLQLQRGKSKWRKFAGNLWTPMVVKLKTILSNSTIILWSGATISSQIKVTYLSFMPNSWSRKNPNLPSPITLCLLLPTMPTPYQLSKIKQLSMLWKITLIQVLWNVLIFTKGSPIKIMRTTAKTKRKETQHRILMMNSRETKVRAHCLKGKYSTERKWRCRRAAKARVSPSLVHCATMERSHSF